MMISDARLREDQEIRFNRPLDRLSLERLLLNLDTSLFDGHSEFLTFGPEERLEWISQVALFVTRFCGAAAASRSAAGSL